MASEKNISSTGVNKAVIVNISSVLGSISQNDQGGFYPYRTSKVIYISIILLFKNLVELKFDCAVLYLMSYKNVFYTVKNKVKAIFV